MYLDNLYKPIKYQAQLTNSCTINNSSVNRSMPAPKKTSHTQRNT